MKLLLDTHIWLWSTLEPKHLSRRVVKALKDTKNELWLSPISAWELQILVEKKRVVLSKAVSDWIVDAMSKVPLQEAPITHEVALETQYVNLTHRDPADKFLAATAKVFDLTLDTADRRLIDAKGLSILANR